MAALILFGPVLALLVVVAVEALADVLRIASAAAVGAMAAGVIGWVLVQVPDTAVSVGAEGD